MHRDSIEPRIASDIATVSPKGGSIGKSSLERLAGKATSDVGEMRTLLNSLLRRVKKLEAMEYGVKEEEKVEELTLRSGFIPFYNGATFSDSPISYDGSIINIDADTIIKGRLTVEEFNIENISPWRVPYYDGLKFAESIIYVSSSTGDIGINESSPDSLLHITDTSSSPAITLEGNCKSQLHNYVSAGREILLIRAKEDTSQGAGINLYGDSDSTFAGEMKFFTNNSTRITIKIGGKVGINETNPDSLLHITDASYPAITLEGNCQSKIQNSTSAGREILSLHGKENSASGASINLYGDGDSNLSGCIYMFTGDTTSLCIRSNGRVGINEDDPDNILHIKNTSYPAIILEGNCKSRIQNSTSGGREILSIDGKENGTSGGSINLYGDGDSNLSDSIFMFTGDTTSLCIRSNGRVGINEGGPDSLLHITDTSSSPTITLEGNCQSTIFNYVSAGREALILNAKTDYTHGASLWIYGENDSIHAHEFRFLTGNAFSMTITSDSDVGIVTDSPAGKLDIAYGGMTVVLGADSGARTRTNTTDKIGRIAFYHYTNAEEQVAGLTGSSTVDQNNVSIGGGTSLTNAATHINFWTALNNTTTTGTIRMTIDYAGSVAIKQDLTVESWLKVENHIYAEGNVQIDSDAFGLILGDGQDAKIYYDGTDLLIYANVVGTGSVKFKDSSIFIENIKSGATQAAAGAAANEVWKTSGHATLPDHVLVMGV